ncbi:Ribosome biogenesis protein Rrp12 [Schizosaccharomyces pombe]|uniref:Putative ribosomal RNA-processing protein 12 n=1 Tax=Schizosaccharomyces pombe (strain 972 / ATCC 24843) TaxID=284812 RepID=RRP12_SCHPO|nr:putative ribosome biogenesis protein Rrp12 [Schizosaccharomyces pombe]Q9C0X8.1 RecName: Full=Putative ribosomal RNA-processing protein 12 [Schizosaccharomyces pombe 972h-]CAC37426.1 ribosome biogenesis protein Rrp12 (predicted) [Schizosaccharomyces pombe]|eukprot:NP_594781.1 putative ribosome biogenesis protein Rrp12 [Schizosaccharomyces pombe]
MAEVNEPLQIELRKIRNSSTAGVINEFDVIVSAVEGTLKEQKTEATPTAYLVALLTLVKEFTDLKKNFKGHTFQLLELVIKYVPSNVLQAKFPQILSVLAPVVNNAETNKTVLLPYLNVLEKLLLLQDYSSWTHGNSCKTSIYILLFFALSNTEKTRVRSLQILANILKNPPAGPVTEHPAIKYTAFEPLRLLESLATAKKPKTPAEVQKLNNSLVLIRVLCSSTHWPMTLVERLCRSCVLIVGQRSTNSILLVYQILDGLSKKSVDYTDAVSLRMTLICLQKLEPSEHDPILMVGWLKAMNTAIRAFNILDKETAKYECLHRFKAFFTLLESESMEIRLQTATTICSVIGCLDTTPNSFAVVEEICSFICDALRDIRFRLAYPECFQIISSLCDKLGPHSDPYLIPALEVIDYLRGSEGFDGKALVDEAIGSFVRAIGPEAMLRVLPLNLELNDKDAVGRAWLLPVLRDNIRFANLAHFTNYFVPLSGQLYQKVIEMNDLDSIPSKLLQTLVDQIWSLLPGYCYLPLDLQSSFTLEFASILVNVLYEQVSLRSVICNSLTALVETNSKVADKLPLDDVISVPVSASDASSNLAFLTNMSSNFLSVLLNVFSSTPSQYRYPILKCIQTWIFISSNDTIHSVYKKVTDLLPDSLNDLAGSFNIAADGISSPMAYSLIDLLIVISPYLNQDYAVTLFEYVHEFLRHVNPAIQKKGYKLLGTLLRVDYGKAYATQHVKEIFEELSSVADRVVSSTRKDRLASLNALYELQSSELVIAIPQLLPEAIISLKEVNEKARHTAFQLLFNIAKSAVNSVEFGNSKPERVEKFVSVISAGLAGSSTHMISATIIAISSIVMEYKVFISEPFLVQLISTLNLFITSSKREIAKAAIDFIKISVSSFPVECIKPLLPELIPNLLAWSHEGKANLRVKVRHLFEKMGRKYGIAEIEPFFPAEDKKLITNIRKTQERNIRKRAMKRDPAKPSSAQPRKTFASAYEAAVYDTDDEAEEEFENDEMNNGNGGDLRMDEAFVQEDNDEEPLDLLDIEAVSKISSTDPRKKLAARKQKLNSAFKSNEEGRLLINDSDEDELIEDSLANAQQHAEVNRTYLEAVAGKESFRRGLNNRVKFSNKRVRDDYDEEMEEVEVPEVTRKPAKQKFDRKQRGQKGY